MAEISAHDLYHAMITDDMPVELQNRVFAYAAKAKDIEIMVSLTRIANLDEDVDNALAKRTEADVLRSWATRPGRSTEQLVERFSKEKRATLLAELAGRDDLTPELYLELSKNASASVAIALLANSTAPEQARIEVAGRAVTTVREGYSTAGRVSAMFRDLPPAVADSAVAAATSPRQLTGLLAHVSQGTLMPVVDRLITMMSEQSVDWNNRSAFDAVWNRLSSADREQMQVRLRTFLDHCTSSQARQIANEFLNRPLVDPIAAAVQQLKVETDPETIRSLYHQVNFSTYQSQREALYAAIENPHSPIDLCSSELGWASTEQLIGYVGRPDFTYEVAVSQLINHGSNDLFAVCAKKFDPKDLARDICVGDTPPYWLIHTAVIGMNPQLMLELYPIEIVLRESSTAALARTMIVEHLGADDQSWEMFARLMPEWTANLASLLNAVDQLA